MFFLYELIRHSNRSTVTILHGRTGEGGCAEERNEGRGRLKRCCLNEFWNEAFQQNMTGTLSDATANKKDFEGVHLLMRLWVKENMLPATNYYPLISGKSCLVCVPNSTFRDLIFYILYRQIATKIFAVKVPSCKHRWYLVKTKVNDRKIPERLSDYKSKVINDNIRQSF